MDLPQPAGTAQPSPERERVSSTESPQTPAAPTTPEVSETPTRVKPDLRYDPGGPDRDCSDFETQREAQDFFEAAGGPDETRISWTETRTAWLASHCRSRQCPAWPWVSYKYDASFRETLGWLQRALCLCDAFCLTRVDQDHYNFIIVSDTSSHQPSRLPRR